MANSAQPVKQLTSEEAEKMKKELEQFFKDFEVNMEWHAPLLQNLLTATAEEARARMDILRGPYSTGIILKKAPRVPSLEAKRRTDVLILGEQTTGKSFSLVDQPIIRRDGPPVLRPVADPQGVRA